MGFARVKPGFQLQLTRNRRPILPFMTGPNVPTRTLRLLRLRCSPFTVHLTPYTARQWELRRKRAHLGRESASQPSVNHAYWRRVMATKVAP